MNKQDERLAKSADKLISSVQELGKFADGYINEFTPRIVRLAALVGVACKDGTIEVIDVLDAAIEKLEAYA